MGTTVSSLQILGAEEETVRAALPGALVGTWSERFVTACPDLSFGALERKAGVLSRKLGCTVLSVSMFDGDVLSLALYQDGKRLTRHIAGPEAGENAAGNPKLFCAALGLPEELAPRVKRLFAACFDQEEKLGILQALLGTPLYLRYGDEEEGKLPEGPVKAGSGPLKSWLREHPEPPKIKNQCRAELIQEIPDRAIALQDRNRTDTFIFRPAVREGDPAEEYVCQRAGDILGYACTGGEWACPSPDGRLELTPLEDPSQFSHFDNYSYARMDRRLVTAADLYGPDPSGYPGARRPVQSVIVHDTAGILPCPCPLTLDDGPAIAQDLRLLPDGGFLAVLLPASDEPFLRERVRLRALVRYGPDGTRRWALRGAESMIGADGAYIYAKSPGDDGEPDRLLALNMDGSLAAERPIRFSRYGTQPFMMDGVLYVLEPLGHQKDALLRRLSPDLRPDGEVLVPYMSSLALSPDGTLLYAAGFDAGLRVMDAKNLEVLHNLPRRGEFHSPAADGQNRLWVGSGGAFFECYTPSLELISRHRLKGEVCDVWRNGAGQVCALTSQQKTCINRVYRFS